MINAQCLKKTPKTVAHMKSYHRHREEVKYCIEGILKGLGYYVINSLIGFVRVMKIKKMKEQKDKDEHSRIRHDGRSDSTSASPFI